MIIYILYHRIDPITLIRKEKEKEKEKEGS